jgi:hypothetical protein
MSRGYYASISGDLRHGYREIRLYCRETETAGFDIIHRKFDPHANDSVIFSILMDPHYPFLQRSALRSYPTMNE